MKKYILNRLSEPSTWRGLIFILTAVGVSVTPEQSEAIVASGMAIAGALGAFLPEAK